MKYLSTLAILVALVACTSAVTIPNIFLVDNIVNFCAFETYLSQYTSKLSSAGKAYYAQAYHAWVQEMANRSGPLFSNVVATNQADVATLLAIEKIEILIEFGRLIGYNQPIHTVAADFNLCSYQTMLKSYIESNIKTQEGLTALRSIFNKVFTDLIAQGPEIMNTVSGIMAPLYDATVPAVDRPLFEQIGSTYGLKI